LPIPILILINGLVCFANFATKNYTLYDHSKSLAVIKNNYSHVGIQDPNSSHIFLVPEHLIQDANKLTRTKSLLKHRGTMFMESSSKPEITALLIQKESTDILKYYTPVLKREINTSLTPATLLTLGISREYISSFLGLFSENMIQYKDFDVSNSTILSNRILAGLRPLHLLIKSSYLGKINPNWKWENFRNTSTDILLLYSQKLFKLSPAKNNVVFLSDLENQPENNIFLTLTNFFTQEERKYYEEILDINLSEIIKSLSQVNADSVSLLPYMPQIDVPKFSFYYTNISGQNGDLKTYNTMFNTQQNPFFCRNTLTYNHSNKSLAFNEVKFSNQKKPFTHLDYKIYLQHFFSKNIMCYNEDGKIYLIEHSYKNNHNSHQLENLQNFKIQKVESYQNSFSLSESDKANFITQHKNEIFK